MNVLSATQNNACKCKLSMKMIEPSVRADRTLTRRSFGGTAAVELAAGIAKRFFPGVAGLDPNIISFSSIFAFSSCCRKNSELDFSTTAGIYIYLIRDYFDNQEQFLVTVFNLEHLFVIFFFPQFFPLPADVLGEGDAGDEEAVTSPYFPLGDLL